MTIADPIQAHTLEFGDFRFPLKHRTCQQFLQDTMTEKLRNNKLLLRGVN